MLCKSGSGKCVDFNTCECNRNRYGNNCEKKKTCYGIEYDDRRGIWNYLKLKFVDNKELV